jgi:hypothetical protein
VSISWQLEDEPKQQGGLDRMIGEFLLSTSSSSWRWLPGGDHSEAALPPLGDPECDIASLNERSVVVGPIADAVLRLVFWMHSRIHGGSVAHEACIRP